MEQVYLLLTRHPITKDLRDDVVRTLANLCEQIDLRTGDILHKPGDQVDALHLVIQGRLKQLSNVGQDVGELINYLPAGTQFGGLAAVRDEPLDILVDAQEPATILKVNIQEFLELTRQHPQLLINFMMLVGDMLKRQLKLERLHRPPKIALLLLESDDERQLTEGILNRLVALGEHPCLMTDSQRWKSRSDIEQINLRENGGWVSPEVVRSQVAQWTTRERVILETTSDIPEERLTRGMQLADTILVGVTCDNWEAKLKQLRNLTQKAPNWREKIFLVWLLDKGHLHPPNATELRSVSAGDFKIAFDESPEKWGTVWKSGLERIIHHLRGVKIGLALGGGAARGMAHLGVLKKLEEYGVVPDMIAGTSAGAMTGTLYASGMELDYTIQSFIKDLTPSWIFRKMPGGGYWYLLYKYRRRQFDPMLRKYLKHLKLPQLPVPMNSITVDLVSGEAKVRSEGDAVRGIVESINLPGLAKPIVNNGEALVDGGLVNNIPADVLVKKGCNFVIAVTVTAELERVFGKIRPDQSHKCRPPSTLQTIMRGYLVQSVNMNSVGIQPADVIVSPDVTGFDLTEFTRTDELAAIGAETTEAAMNEILGSLREIDPQLFTNR